MKLVIILFFLILSTISYSTTNAQCVLSASDNTVGEVISCLTGCGCTSVIVPNGVTITLANDWDLTSQGAITITIEDGGQLVLNGNGSNNNELKLDNGSILFIENTDPDDEAIKTSSGNGQVKITIGGYEYKASDFDKIIEAGGADETPDNGVLPVELVSFEAQNMGNAIKLSWATASELNNDYFTLEKSKNGRDFQTLTTVEGNGTVNAPSYYNFMDSDPFLGLSYYRLSQTDYDGTMEVLTVVSVLHANEKASFSIYPNPVVGQSFHLAVEGKGKYERLHLNIIDMQGKVMEKIAIEADQFGIVDRDIQLVSRLQKGNYIFELNSTTGKSHLKVVRN